MKSKHMWITRLNRQVFTLLSGAFTAAIAVVVVLASIVATVINNAIAHSAAITHCCCHGHHRRRCCHQIAINVLDIYFITYCDVTT